MDLGLLITVTAVLIGLFLALKYSDGFQTMMGQGSNAIFGGISALMGPSRG